MDKPETSYLSSGACTEHAPTFLRLDCVCHGGHQDSVTLEFITGGWCNLQEAGDSAVIPKRCCQVMYHKHQSGLSYRLDAVFAAGPAFAHSLTASDSLLFFLCPSLLYSWMNFFLKSVFSFKIEPQIKTTRLFHTYTFQRRQAGRPHGSVLPEASV